MKIARKLVAKIGDRITLYADEFQYILETKRNLKDKTPQVVYLFSLSNVFDDIYENAVKEKIADGKDKTLLEISKMIKEVKKDISILLKPFEFLKPYVKS